MVQYPQSLAEIEIVRWAEWVRRVQVSGHVLTSEQERINYLAGEKLNDEEAFFLVLIVCDVK